MTVIPQKLATTAHFICIFFHDTHCGGKFFGYGTVEVPLLLHYLNTLYTELFHFCTFEAFNSVIRQLNVYSNCHASSKDIGEKYVSHHLLKFLISGGCWENGDKRYNKQMLFSYLIYIP